MAARHKAKWRAVEKTRQIKRFLLPPPLRSIERIGNTVELRRRSFAVFAGGNPFGVPNPGEFRAHRTPVSADPAARALPAGRFVGL